MKSTQTGPCTARVTAQLRQEGHPINRKRVQPAHKIYPTRIMSVALTCHTSGWSTGGCTWSLLSIGIPGTSWPGNSRTLGTTVCADAREAGAHHRVPTIWHHQGSHFTSPQYTAILLAVEVQINMDSKGRAMDNIFTERLWRCVKYEHKPTTTSY